jgi:hypothetical protein
VSEPERLDASRLDIDLMRQIDAVCRRFETDWRAGAQNPLDDYLADIPDEGRAALRAELEALERELHRSEETGAHGESSPGAELRSLASAYRSAPAWGSGILAPLDRRAAEHTRFPSSQRSARRSDRPKHLRRISAARCVSVRLCAIRSISSTCNALRQGGF